MALIKTVDIEQKYAERYILKNINLKIDGGEVFALIGPTGAGKTTLLRLLGLLELPSSGDIYFDGIDVTSSKRFRLEARRRMSFVLQKPVVFNMTVYDNVACGLRWRQEEKGSIGKRVSSVLGLVGMADYKDRNARELSGGEIQRVAIARALAVKPEVLFLDEPTANLDPVSTSKIEEILAHIIQEQETTIIMATHDMSQGQRLAGRIGVLMNGEILQVGSPIDIFSSPENKEMAEFVGVENILGGVITHKDNSLVTIEVDDRLIQAISDYNLGERVSALLRPEDITISLSKDTSSARNIFDGKITRTLSMGTLVRIEVDCGFPLLCVITKRSAEDLNLTAGKEIYTSFKATAVHVIRSWN
ncbi:ABC transporter ATP-binding protein [Chloroflexota bacterium]